MGNEHTHYDSRKTETSLQDLLAVVLKRKWIVISFALVVIVTVTIASFLQKPSYTAIGTILIEKEPNILSFQEIYQIETFNSDYYQTQYKILESRTLAGNTIEQIKLYENEKFIGKPKKGRAFSDKSSSAFREELIDTFLDRLSVKPIPQTRLVEVSFRDHEPKFAADILNAFLDAYIDMNIRKKYQATEQATEFLAKQIASVNAEIEEKEKKLQEYGAAKNIIALSDKETTILERLGGLNRALTGAQIDRVNKETNYNEIKNANPDYIPEALANPLIQRLREDYGRLNREYIKKSEIFKLDFPEMQRLKAELDTAKDLLNNETQNLIKGAYSDYQTALKKEKSFEEAFNRQKQEAFQLNNNAILYNSSKVEIENKKSVLASLLKRQSETDVSARLKGLRTSNVSIIDRAAVPLYPSSPKKKLNIILAFLIGLFGGLGMAFLFEYLDSSVKNFRDVEKYTGLPTLGIIPAFTPNGYRKFQLKEEREKTGMARVLGQAETKPEEYPKIESIELITQLLPKSKISENYRSIRTTLFLSSADSQLKSIAISSPFPQEGKTATISNLAVTFAQTDKKVLLIDSDLRKPMQHKIFKIKNLSGLTNFLSGNGETDNLVKKTLIPNLYLINSGPVAPNPLELLGSEKMANLIDSLKQHFDYILFDTPPILPVSDAIVLGPKVDGVILVAWGGKTSGGALQQAKEKLEIHKIKCIGVILNNIRLEGHDYYYMRQYYHYYGQ
jgi:capsular exopolysaccharide synthesis family protein